MLFILLLFVNTLITFSHPFRNDKIWRKYLLIVFQFSLKKKNRRNIKNYSHFLITFSGKMQKNFYLFLEILPIEQKAFIIRVYFNKKYWFLYFHPKTLQFQLYCRALGTGTGTAIDNVLDRVDAELAKRFEPGISPKIKSQHVNCLSDTFSSFSFKKKSTFSIIII